MKLKLTTLACTAVVLFAACNNGTETKVAGAHTNEDSFQKDSVQATINASNEKFGNAMSGGDSVTIVRSYTSDAKVFPPNMEGGSPSILGSMVTHIPSMGIKSVKLETKDLHGAGDYAIEEGTYKMSDGSKDLDKGKFIVVWKKEGGQWKMYRDIWNSDNPPPPAPNK